MKLGLIVLITVIFLLLIKSNTPLLEGFNDKWTRDPTCRNRMIKVLQHTLDKYKIPKAQTEDEWSLYLPCSYTYSQTELKKLQPTNDDQKIFIIKNCDQLSNKNYLWSCLVKSYGTDGAQQFMPNTYVLHKPEDLTRLQNEHKNGKLYIMKKNIQRQQGLLITKDIQQILRNRKQFVVVQELLQNPYLISKRKINLRIYLLLTCRNQNITAYYHPNGFMYYTKIPFTKGSTDMDPNVTTGYIERQVYLENPLTLDDFKKYLDTPSRPLTEYETHLQKTSVSRLSNILFNRIEHLLKQTVQAVQPYICNDKNTQTNHLNFQHFGVDVAISDQYLPQLMEINKGPDMGAKDERDKLVKQEVMEDIFKVCQIVPDPDHKFIKIWEN